MQAIAFMTKSEKGVIKIPKEYLNLLKDEFQVIIVVEASETKKNKKKKKFANVKLDTRGYKFSREEANER